MTMISTLAHHHPGLPLFSWDALKQNLSVDGHVLPMNKFINSVHTVIDQIFTLIQQIFRRSVYSDILQFIDTRLDPQDSERWFRDRPQTFVIGTSIFNETDNGFRSFRFRLLEGMSADTNFFSKLDGELVAKKGMFDLSHRKSSLTDRPHPGNLWEWFSLVDELVKLLFFAMINTWGGGARGTECDHLQFEIQDNGQRNLYVLNGLVTIVTQYSKTRSHHGHGKLIARTIPWQLGRLALLVYGVIFPAASHLATFAFDREAAEAYISYMFVVGGKIMNSDDFSKVIASQTSKLFDITMGLRRHRQTMCTILTNLTNVDFGEVDPEDADLMEIHYMFGHSPTTGERNYAIQRSDALREISHTSIASSQRVCMVYHDAIRLTHPNAPKRACSRVCRQPSRTASRHSYIYFSLAQHPAQIRSTSPNLSPPWPVHLKPS
jgi:hypothetical protein